MKQIGYIFKYNKEERKGILVYGHWKSGQYFLTHKNKPIKFTSNDCITEVETGQLVYFELTERRITNIERASLNNFKVEVINNIITCKTRTSDNWYYENTHILYQHINIPRKSNPKDKTLSRRVFSDKFNRTFHVPFDSIRITPQKEINQENQDLSIDEWYNLFWDGKDENVNDRSISVNILDIDLWVDDDILQKQHYGMTAEEVLYLCDIFIYKKRLNKEGKTILAKRDNDYISDTWESILSTLTDEDLRQVITKASIIQPALPNKFCIENLELLTDKYGMPNINICKSYNLYHIENAKTVSDYEDLNKNLYVYAHCNANHIEGEGVPMCKMGKSYIKKLFAKLETRFDKVIAEDIKSKFKKLTGTDYHLIYVDQDKKKETLLAVGRFIERLEILSSYDYSVISLFEDLPKDFQNAFYFLTRNKINQTIFEQVKNTIISPTILQNNLQFIEKWIDETTVKQVIDIVNPIYINLDNIDDLKDAYNINCITNKQFYKRFRELTSEYNISEFAEQISKNYWSEKQYPLIIQWYIISRIINLFDLKSLDSFNYIKLDYNSINNIRDLLEWIENQVSYGYIRPIIKSKAEQLILSNLKENEKWTLYEAGLVSTIDKSVIKNQLIRAYRKNKLDHKLFEKECFQHVMLQDALKTTDLQLKYLIVNHLDSSHLKIMYDKSDGAIKLFIWVLNPNDTPDWDLITTHMGDLSDNQQLRLFKFIFHLLANKKIQYTIEDLYEIFVNGRNRVCPSLRGVLYLLKEKLLSPETPISSQEFDKYFCKRNDMIELRKNLKIIKQLFYGCNGYLALTHIKADSDYQSFNGFVDTISIDDKLYYAITFYDTPHDIFDNVIEWLGEDEINEAKSVLEQNIKIKIVNGQYLINLSEELALKQFMMSYHIDDHCCILDSKSAMIQKGYLPPKSTYQPLYTNQLRQYDSDSYIFCRDYNYCSSDPIFGIPFYWCNKKPCVRRCHYIVQISQWEKYKFSDFLYILCGCKKTCLTKVWNITSEISDFLNIIFTNRMESHLKSTPRKNVKKSSEIGTLTKNLSVVQDICDWDEDEDEEEISYDYNYDSEECSYGRYSGSYAQDEMEYSDDDIDTIFDGDPDAYWNID